MATHDEVERIAASMNQLRPEWSTRSLVTFLHKFDARPYRVLAVAATYVATDPRTLTPNLLTEHGPWWVAAATLDDHTDHRFTRCTLPGHGSFPATNCSACRSEHIERTGEPPSAVEDTTTSETARVGAHTVRAALAAARTVSRPTNT